MAKRTVTPKIEQLMLSFPRQENDGANVGTNDTANDVINADASVDANIGADIGTNAGTSMDAGARVNGSVNAGGTPVSGPPAGTRHGVSRDCRDCRDCRDYRGYRDLSDCRDPVALAREGLLFDLLALYLERCTSPRGGLPAGDRSAAGNRVSRQETEKPGKNAPPRRFPNLAGFCRFLGVGTAQMERLSDEEPELYDTLSAVFEDEALNSGISASVLTPYFKYRLGYGERTVPPPAGGYDDGTVRLVFDHDIWEDGA